MKIRTEQTSIWTVLTLALALAPGAFALSGDLQGLHKANSTNFNASSPWTGVNLQDWKELDYIPCRVSLSGGPATNQLVKITFPHFVNGVPGFQNLYFLSNSVNTSFTEGPTLHAPRDARDWWYEMRITVTNNKPAYIYFLTRLAAGAHLNVGSSLHLDGEPSLSPLQIHKPGPGKGSPNLAVTKTAITNVFPAQTVTYTLSYENKATSTNNPGTGVQLTDILPETLTYVPGSASAGGSLVGDTLTWDLPNLPVGATGSVTYQAQVEATATYGSTFTNTALILSSEDDANMTDNRAALISFVSGNYPPTARPDSYSIAEDSVLSIVAPGVLSNDSDPESDPLRAILVTGTMQGTITLNSNGSFVYSPNANFNGTDSFTYLAADSKSNSAPVQVTIVVTPINDAPVASNDIYSVKADNVLTISSPGVLANDSDADGNALSAVIETTPAHGTAALSANGGFTYIPNAGFSGSDSFQYRASDGFTNSAPATVMITVFPQTIVVTNPPTDRTNCPGDTVTFEVGASGTALTYQWFFETNALAHQTNRTLVLTNVASTNTGEYCVVVNGAAGGPLTNCANLLVNEETTVITPPTNRVVCPGEEVSFTVTATGTDLSYEWYHGTTRIDSTNTSTLLLTNVTALDAGSYSVITRGACGEFVTNTITLTVNETVTIVTPPATKTSYVGSNVTFDVVATGTALNYAWYFDGVLVGTNSSLELNNLTTNRSGTYCVVVSGACGAPVTNCTPLIIENRAPIANHDSYAIDEDTTLQIGPSGVLANDVDPDGDILTASLVAAPTHGTLTLNVDGSFSYVPTQNFNGTDSFTYRAQDGRTSSAPATVTITIRPVNDRPVAVADEDYRTPEDTLLWVPAAAGVLTNDFDIDTVSSAAAANCIGCFNGLQAVLVDTTTNGSLTLASDGSFTYLPSTNFFGVDHFTYRAHDGVSTSDVAVATITVQSVNDAPTVRIVTPNDGSFFTALATIAVTATASDVDGVVTNVGLYLGTNLLQSFNVPPYSFVLSNQLPGIYSFIATATDDGGITVTSAIVSVTVTSPPLTVVCADAKTVELGNAWSFDPPTALHGCGTRTITVVSTFTNRLCGSTFSALRTWRATDECGNTAECSQLVTVVDTTPPTVTAAPDKVQEIGTVWTFDTPTATDLSGAIVTVVTTSTNAGACGSGFVAVRTWVATDGCGNTTPAHQTVTVLDRTAPVLTCPNDKSVEAGVAWSFDAPTATDLSSYTIAPVSTITNVLCGGSFVAIRTWSAVDACSNSNSCSQRVTVTDTSAPTINILSPTNGQVFIKPATISIVTEAYDAGGIASVRFFANSNALGWVSNAPYHFSWTNAPVATSQLYAVATDLCGRSATSSIVTISVTTNTLFAAGEMGLNKQNGFFEQHLTIYNLTADTWESGVRVFVEIDKTNVVWNATGKNQAGVAFIDKAGSLAPGGTLDVLVQYYVPNVRSLPSPKISAVPLPYSPAPLIAPRVETIGSSVRYESMNNCWYYLQWSDNLKNWNTKHTPLRGTGGLQEWPIDKSESKRFYRVLLVP